MPRLRPILAVVTALVALTACTSKPAKNPTGTDSSALPAAAELVKATATNMSSVKSAHFVITADGTVAGLTLHKAEGDLTKEGTAQGSATIDQLGTTVEVKFVIVGDSIYLKGPTGDYQKLPLALAATIYDPSAILDPERGIPKVLNTATDAKSTGTETVAGKAATVVTANFNGGDLSTVVPGATGTVPGKLWIGTDSKQLLKAQFTLPASGTDKGATVTVEFSKFDVPVTISAPQ